MFTHARRRILAVISASLLPCSTLAQGMMDHVDLSSPRMSESEVTRDEVEALIAAGGPVDLQDKSLNGLDLSGLDLHGANFAWARFNRADLSNAILDGANFDLAWGIEARMDGASMVGASFNQTQLLRASLQGADLSQSRITADMSMAQLNGAKFIDADMAADMRNQSMGLMRAVLRSARLEGADLTGARLDRADMEFAKLKGAVMRGTSLNRAELGGADLTGADLAGANVSEADFDSAKLVKLSGRDEIIGLDTARHLNRATKDW